MVTSQQTKDISSGMMKISEFETKFKKEKIIKYEPPSLYGISNTGVGNPLSHRLQRLRNSDGLSGFGSKSSRKLDFLGRNDDKYSSMEDILSQASNMRQKMNLPMPKNKNPELFISDISESDRKKRRIIYKRNKNLTANRTYGHKQKVLPNMTEIINHDYMNTFTRKMEEKSDKLRKDNQAKIRRLKNFADVKVNNTVLRRNNAINKNVNNFKTASEVSNDPSKYLSYRKEHLSPNKDKTSFYRKINSPAHSNLMIDATRPN